MAWHGCYGDTVRRSEEPRELDPVQRRRQSEVWTHCPGQVHFMANGDDADPRPAQSTREERRRKTPESGSTEHGRDVLENHVTRTPFLDTPSDCERNVAADEPVTAVTGSSGAS